MRREEKSAVRRMLSIVLILMTAGTLLTACSGKTDKDPGAVSVQPASEVSETAADPENTGASQTQTGTPESSELSKPAAGPTKEESVISGTKENISETQPEQVLYGIKYESSDGDMVYHSEFKIEVNREEMVSCAYWPEDEGYQIEMTRKEHVPITKEQWADLESIIGTLLPLMSVIPDSVLNATPDPDLEILDGGDYTNLCLTWETESGLETYAYYWPQDRRVRTLIGLLQELADPQGREIEWYPEPVLCGLYFSDGKNDYSWQMTLVGKEGTDYRYITYFKENGDRDSVNITVSEEIWKEAYAFLEPLNLGDFPAGGYKDKYYCTLYISDGSQKGIKLDKKTAASLREFFSGLTEEVRQKK